ncbi:MAG: SecD/SecF fusion protein [Gaiellaceae bacterium]|jgi:SecD/SecF fusion protein|nr:SecD/SecF fusion protein [Gaiellaceae bacterium]
MGLILAAVIGAGFLAIPGSPAYKKPTLGLDLQGGLEIILKAVPQPGQTITPQQMQTAQQIMVNRVDKLGVASPNVALQGSDEIVIQLAGVHDLAEAAKVVGSTGQLQFFDFEKDLADPTVNANGVPTPYPRLYTLLKAVEKDTKKGKPQAYYLFGAKTHYTTTTVNGKKKVAKTVKKNAVLAGPFPKRSQLIADVGGKQPPDTTILGVPANTEAVSGPAAGAPVKSSANGVYWYLFKYYPDKPDGPPELTGSDLNEGNIQAGFDNFGQPQVQLGFTDHGAKEFQAITKAEWERGKFVSGLAGDTSGTVNQAYAQHNAIVLDNKLQSTPYIDYTDESLRDGIVGGQAVINHMQSTTASKNLALVLQSGSLPYSFHRLAESEVTATLGKSSLHEAILAAIAGLVIVALFLLALYRFLGLVAVIGLAIYGLLYYAAILIFNVTLTLPGFAGLILTIGVAADANVVVFERIKEEVRAGKSVRSAISAGYGKGFHTILDANVVTVITAMVIFLIAVADVKGFALMLLIGTMISLLTAVAATRALLGLLSGFRWFDNPRFMGAHGQQTAKWMQIDFMKRRNTWFALSGAIIAAGVVALGVSGLNLGIDFTGGTQITFTTPKAYPQSTISELMAKQGRADAYVQGKKPLPNGDARQWQIRFRDLDQKKQAALQSSLENQVGAHILGAKSVSGTFGHQIAIDAIYGIIVSLLLITIYITIRFDLKFAIPVILAMLHDIAITVGVYALVGKEVSVATVAAVLTVLGYSIYDTIIIFDRIRENTPLMRRSPFATIVNVSLWETVRRSLATTLITLLPIICLEVLGGATLKDFAFALIVGVTSGAYSSFFFAAPILTIWKEREPEYARRRETVTADAGTAALLESEEALAAEPTPGLVDGILPTPAEAQARRDKRSQRRRSRPHGRTR